MKIENVLPELRKPFHPSHVTWKPQSVTKDGAKAMACAYADVRAYQNRLDEVCGMDWSVTYTPWGDRIVCHVTIMGVTRSSSGESDAQSERSEIGGTAAESQAFKRACAMFGLGRYLYTLPSVWVELEPGTKHFSAAGGAKLEAVIVQHYRRTMQESPAPQQTETQTGGVAVETMERLREDLDRLGLACYGEQWTQVCRHNVERITSGAATEVTALTVEQMTRLIDGMKKLQGKRTAAA